MKKLAKYVCFFVAAAFLFSGSAQAYIGIDPATGSYLIQIVAGVVIACGAAVGIFWSKIKKWFTDRKLKAAEAKIVKDAKQRDESEK